MTTVFSGDRVGAKLCSRSVNGGRRGWRLSRPRQHEFGAQPADRRGTEREAAAIEAGEFDHDRKPQPRARLGLVETAAAAGDLLALLRRKPRPVVVDHDAHDPTIIPWIRLFRECLDGHPRLRPLAGIVDKVADHFLEVLLLATEACTLGRVDVDGDTAMVMNLFHRASERHYHRTHIGDGTDRGDARGEPRALEMARDLVAHNLGLLAHLQGERITAMTCGLVHHD